MTAPEPLLERLHSIVDLRTKVVLDVGCGDGVRTKDLAAFAKRVVALDTDPALLRQARQTNGAPNVEYHRADAVKLPFPPASFDVVLFSMSFHHIPPPRMGKGLSETIRVTARRGSIVLLERDWAGTLPEAEQAFAFGDGDLRATKGYLYHVFLTEPRIVEVAEFFDRATYHYDSVSDFVEKERPRRGTRAAWRRFLADHRYRLWEEQRLHIFRKRS